MKYIIFTYSGEGLPIAKRLQDEGQDVLVAFIENEEDIMLPEEFEKYKGEDPEKKKRRLSLFDGIINKISAKEATRRLKITKKVKDYFLFFDFNQNFKFAEQLKNKGYHGNFPTEDDRRLEVDRNLAKEFINKNYKLDKQEVQEFKKIDDAKKFLETTDKIWVLKGMDDEAQTVVPDKDDPELAKEQIVSVLEKNKQIYEKTGFILEQKIENPIEITPERQYYDGKLLFTDIDIELKRIGAGDLGIMTGCAADLVFLIDNESNISKKAFPEIVDKMAKDHKGWFIWDISLLYDPKTNKVYPGEFCPNRTGYNAFYTLLAQFERASDFFESIVKGETPKTISKFGTSVRLFDIQHDHKDHRAKVGNNITIQEEAKPDVWLMDVKQNKDKLVAAGYDHNPNYVDIGVVTGFGNSIDEAVERMYEYVDMVSYEGILYRPIFDYVSKDYPTSILNRYNYLIDNKLINETGSSEANSTG